MRKSKFFEFAKFDDEQGDLFVDLDEVKKFRVVRDASGDIVALKLYFEARNYDELTGAEASAIIEKLNARTGNIPKKHRPRRKALALTGK